MRIRIVTPEKQRLWCKLHLTTSVVNGRSLVYASSLVCQNLPRYSQRTEPSQISLRQCSFLPPSSLFFGPLTIATSYVVTSSRSAIKWPTRETDALVEIASINFFAVVNDLNRRCKKVGEVKIYLQTWYTSKIQLFYFSRDLSFVIFILLYLFQRVRLCRQSKRSFLTMTFKRDDRKGDSANLSQVGRNISDTFNTRLSSWWHVLV